MENSEKRNSFFDKIPFIIKLTLAVLAGLVLFVFLLSSNICVREGAKANLLTAAYTAISAFTLNGSSLVDISSYWSNFGICIILICMQCGALCAVCFGNALFLRVGSFIKVKFLSYDEILTVNNPESVKRFVLFTSCTVLIAELAGFVLYLMVFVPAFGWAKGAFYSLFGAVSAFSGCGMSILSGMEKFVFDYNVLYNLITFVMMVLGAVGFGVMYNILSEKKWSKFSFNTKFMLIAFGSLIFAGAFVFLICEYSNPHTMGNMPWYTKIFAAFHLTQAVRGGEISGIDFSCFSFASKALMCFMMFTGGLPGSFTGGVKLGSVGILAVFMFKYPLGIFNKDIGLYRIEQRTFDKALFMVMSACVWILLSAMILSGIENMDYFTAVFECLSAFSLSGITQVGISSFKTGSLVLMMINMIMGRFGTMLLIYAADTNRQKGYGGVEKISKISDLTV